VHSFLRLGVVFHTKCYGSTPMGNFLMGCKCRGKHKSRFSNSGFIACCQRCDRQVLYTQVRQTVTSWWHSLSFVYRGRRTTKCLWQEALTLGRRQQNNILIVRSGKSEAEITTNKRLRSGNCILLKLTSPLAGTKHRAASLRLQRSFSATATRLFNVNSAARDRRARHMIIFLKYVVQHVTD